MTNELKALNPEECCFEGSFNELQQCLQETIRQRIKAEEKLATISPDNEWHSLHAGYLKVCQSWETALTDELIKRFPKGQTVLPL
jgi:hypothetical protein